MLFQPTTPVVQQSLSKSRLAENQAEAAKVTQTFLRAAPIYSGILVALGVFLRDISVFLLGRGFAGAGPVLAVLLVAAAGRTLISAAGERASIVIPLVVLIGAGAVAFALVVPKAGLIGAAWVAAFLGFGTALVSLRDGLRLLKLRYPWATLARVAVAACATAGFGVRLRDRGLPVLLDLSLATLLYGAGGPRAQRHAPSGAIGKKSGHNGRSNLSMSGAGRTRRHPGRARSPGPGAAAPFSIFDLPPLILSESVNFKKGRLTKLTCLTNLFHMHTVTSRDLAHRTKEIRELLVAGKTLQWTSHGAPVALILPVAAATPKPDWLARARAAGAVNQSSSPVADSIYADRD